MCIIMLVRIVSSDETPSSTKLRILRKSWGALPGTDLLAMAAKPKLCRKDTERRIRRDCVARVHSRRVHPPLGQTPQWVT